MKGVALSVYYGVSLAFGVRLIAYAAGVELSDSRFVAAVIGVVVLMAAMAVMSGQYRAD